MDHNYIFLIELFVFNGAALAWAGYELWTVRTPKEKPKSPPPDDTGHPEG
jgi:hypothetical protein